MAGVKVVEHVNASADEVWALFREFGDVDRFVAQVESCQVEGEGIGAVRTLQMGTMQLQERLEAFDDADRTLSYAIVGEHPLPLDDYLSTVKVLPESGGCSIEWSGRYEAKGPPRQVALLIEGVYRAGIAGIKERLGA